MKINQNVSIFAGADTAAGNAMNVFGFQNAKTANSSVSFLKGQTDPIEQKRAMAKKQAYKVVSDTFASEKKIDDDLKAREERIGQLQSQGAQARKKLNAIGEEESQLRTEYGIDPNSQEQKDLELLKQYNRGKYGRNSTLSAEEQQRASELEKQGLTEYQERALNLDMERYAHEDAVQEAESGIVQESATIRAMSLERLKHHPMLDATEEAEGILEAANDEIIGMLREEAKKHIDEKQEEELEKAKEHKEEKEEEEKRLEEAKERREEMEALADPEKAEEKHKYKPDDSLNNDVITEQFVKMGQVKNDVQQEVADIMSQMKLVVEDVKGIKVDTQV